jgi:hypothetical protein
LKKKTFIDKDLADECAYGLVFEIDLLAQRVKYENLDKVAQVLAFVFLISLEAIQFEGLLRVFQFFNIEIVIGYFRDQIFRNEFDVV